MNQEQLYNFILSYFPQHKDEETYSMQGGDCYGLPFLLISNIILTFLSEKTNIQQDIESITHFVNDFYDGKMGIYDLELLDPDMKKNKHPLAASLSIYSGPYRDRQIAYRNSIHRSIDPATVDACRFIPINTVDIYSDPDHAENIPFDNSITQHLNSIIIDALELLYSEDDLKPLFKFSPKARIAVNYWLKKDGRFDKILFGG